MSKAVISNRKLARRDRSGPHLYVFLSVPTPAKLRFSFAEIAQHGASPVIRDRIALAQFVLLREAPCLSKIDTSKEVDS
jgi:hypothetical protein